MKEHPILFSSLMVQAILEGRKTQTRRVIKPQPQGEQRSLNEWSAGLAASCGDTDADGAKLLQHASSLKGQVFPFKREGSSALYSPTCPHGRPGDILWVRETWIKSREVDENVIPIGEWQYFYKADRDNPEFYRPDLTDDHPNYFKAKWKPSIHMPREACRLFLNVKSVRVERLQDISEEDAQQEGCEDALIYRSDMKSGQGTYRDGFQLLWESIYGPDSWLANPYVWVIEFERTTV